MECFKDLSRLKNLVWLVMVLPHWPISDRHAKSARLPHRNTVTWPRSVAGIPFSADICFWSEISQNSNTPSLVHVDQISDHWPDVPHRHASTSTKMFIIFSWIDLMNNKRHILPSSKHSAWEGRFLVSLWHGRYWGGFPRCLRPQVPGWGSVHLSICLHITHWKSATLHEKGDGSLIH